MKKIWIENRVALIAITYIGTFFAVIYFLTIPMAVRVKNVSGQIQGKIIDRKIEEDRLNSLPQMEKDWQDFEAQKNSADVILSPGSEISFIESIDSIAQKSGNIIDLKIGDEVDPKEIAKIKAGAKKNQEQKGIMDELLYSNYFPMQINLRGDYQGLVNFIHMLENGRFYVNVISIDSKKQIVEDDSAASASDIFSPDKAKEEKKTKEVIISAINALVYTQKQ